MPREEKRDLKRYKLAAPATIESNQPDWEDSFQYFMTRDVSGGGAFFKTKQPLRTDTDVKVKIYLEVGKLEKLPLSGHVLIQADGIVSRTESTGMAVKFNSRCQVILVS